MTISRRQLLQTASAASLATLAHPYLLAQEPTAAVTSPPVAQPIAVPKSLRYCLNTSTIRGQKLKLVDEIKIASDAGYQGIEPWMGEIQQYLNDGGTLADLRKRIEDAGLRVESAIGFAEWIVDDEEKRKRGLENAKKDMDTIAQLGGKNIAAPPAGATKQADLSLNAAGERYRALLEAGVQIGVSPQLEVWGFSSCLSKLSEVLYVMAAAGHPAACILPDVYHLYKGGTDFAALKLVAGQAIHCFHMNDYPAEPPREKIGDADRVYCGDGIAPLTEILRMLFTNGFTGTLSLELFNPNYWKEDAAEVAKKGLEKIKAAVAAATM